MKYFLFLIFSLTSGFVYSQESTITTGNTHSGTGGSISFSIGQINNANALGNNGAISTGVHQTYQVTEVIEGIIKTPNSSITIFPNPTADYLNLSVNEKDVNSSSYILLNAEGKVIHEEKMNAPSSKISLAENANGVYFIVVLNNNIKVKSFRVIKNK